MSCLKLVRAKLCGNYTDVSLTTFNPYTQHHPTLDHPNAANIRLANLTHYLRDQQHARITLIGEAAGYAGCRFTGIPFTCEAQLREWDDPRYRTTSRHGDHNERSARCVWHTLFGGRGFSQASPPAKASASCACADVIFWNVFPWHPHLPGNPLSNRKPIAAEIRAGMGVLEPFLDWLRPERVVAVGRVAEQALRTLNVPAIYARHPSHGGQRQFQSAIHSLFSSEFSAAVSASNCPIRACASLDTTHNLAPRNFFASSLNCYLHIAP